MTLRYLVASGLLGAATVAPAMAGDGKAPLRVSAQVVRSCRVTSEQPQVSVDCGTRPQTVLITYDEAQGSLRSVSAPTTVAPTAARTVTVHF